MGLNRSVLSVTLVLPVLLSSSVNASQDVVLPANPFQKPLLSVESEVAASSCTQFTGTWQGHCEGSGGKQPLQMKIDQKDCSALLVDGQSFPIDGMETAASNQGASMANGSTALTWDIYKSKIIGNTQGLGQVLGKRKTLKYQYKGKFTLEKDNSALLLKTESQAETFVNEQKKTEKTDANCRLEKTAETEKLKL